MKISTVEQMRQLDREASSVYGIPGAILMEHAGHAVYTRICDVMGVRRRRFLVLCGTGNNGGDGLVVARKLHSAGAEVRVILAGDPALYSAESAQNFTMVVKAGLTHGMKPASAEVALALAWCDGVVDGLLGTGISRPVEGYYRELIEQVNVEHRRRALRVFAIDIPSGVNGDSGRVQGVAIEADHTVALGLPKLGNLLYPGAGLGGRLAVSSISFPQALQNGAQLRSCVNQPQRLPVRHPDGHKGTFGDALFVAGARGYYGAPTLAGLAHLRAGGGYARLATPASVVPVAAGIASELVFVPQQETAAGSLALANEGALLELAERVDIVVVGPGISLDEETQELARRLTATVRKPLIVDGDGLTAISWRPELLRQRCAPVVLTPHLGEMERLSGQGKEALRADPVGATRRLAAELNAIVVLKGAHSLIGLPDGTVHVNTSGNSGMASAGSGDVLTGTITAAFGLGLPLIEAVRTGVFLHGLAGDLGAERVGEDGMVARELVDSLPAALFCYREAFEEITGDYYGKLDRL